MKTRDYIVLAVLLPLFAACLISFSIAFYYNALLHLHFFRRLFSGEIGWQPWHWKTSLRADVYTVEMRGRFFHFLFITFGVWTLIMLICGILIATGTLKPPPATKPAAPTTAVPPRVLAAPQNPQADAVLK